MKKIGLLMIAVLLLAACSFEVNELDADENKDPISIDIKKTDETEDEEE